MLTTPVQPTHNTHTTYADQWNAEGISSCKCKEGFKKVGSDSDFTCVVEDLCDVEDESKNPCGDNMMCLSNYETGDYG